MMIFTSDDLRKRKKKIEIKKCCLYNGFERISVFVMHLENWMRISIGKNLADSF